jgi:hypothetical protein
MRSRLLHYFKNNEHHFRFTAITLVLLVCISLLVFLMERYEIKLVCDLIRILDLVLQIALVTFRTTEICEIGVKFRS